MQIDVQHRRVEVPTDEQAPRPATMSPMNRSSRIVARLLGTVAVLALVAWVLWPQPEPRWVPGPTAQRSSPEAPTNGPLAGLARNLMTTLTQTTRVRFVVMDALEEPLPGVELVVQGEHGITDASGELMVEGLSRGYWREPEVLGPWVVLQGSTEGPIRSAEQTRLLVLARTCPGAVRVLGVDGSPVAGASVGLGWNPGILRTGSTQPDVTTDHRGEAPLAMRPCGSINFRVGLDSGSAIPPLSAEVTGTETVTLQLPGFSEAVVDVVDDQDQLLDATLETYRGDERTQLGRGRFLIRSRRAYASVQVEARGYPSQLAKLTLDGDEHTLVLQPGRDVEVTVLCVEDCPEALLCTRNTCEPLDEEHFACTCPQSRAWLGSPSHEGYTRVLDQVPAGATQHTLDLRQDAGVKGQWTGALPCTVSGMEIGSWFRSPCRSDGSFEVESLSAGPHTINVQHGPHQQGSVRVVLDAGERADVGEVDPSDWTLDGVIDADFPLDGAMMWSEPGARVELQPDGGFLLRGLPADTAKVTLLMQSPRYGQFEEEFVVSPSGSLPTWVISRAEIADTTPIDDDQGLSWGDPGDSAEPGDWENDTDAPRWRDSGGGDSGDSRLGP